MLQDSSAAIPRGLVSSDSQPAPSGRPAPPPNSSKPPRPATAQPSAPAPANMAKAARPKPIAQAQQPASVPAESEEESGATFKQFLEINSSMLISACFHAAVLLALGFFLLPSKESEVVALTTDRFAVDSPPDELEEFQANAFEDSLEDVVPVDSYAPSITPDYSEPPPAPVSTVAVNAELPDFGSRFGDLGGTISGAGTGSGGLQSGEVEGMLNRVRREGGRSGDVQVTLTWDNKNDIDLHVITPAEEEIYYGHKTSECGGRLDVDMNVSLANASNEPVENVFWPEGNSPIGDYVVYVNHYRRHDGQEDPTEYQVLVIIGDSSQIFKGSIRASDSRQEVIRFTRTDRDFELYTEDWDFTDEDE